MKRVVKLLRDPIWQFVGAVAGIVALAIAAPKPEEPIPEFRVVRNVSATLEFLASTTDSLSISSDGKELDSNRISFHYYHIHNRGSRTMSASDFIGGLQVKPSRPQDRILSVKEVCTAVCDVPAVRWKQEGQLFVALPTVINRNEGFNLVVYVLSEMPSGKGGRDAAPVWAARINGYRFAYYSDPSSPEPDFADVGILLSGWAIYLLLAFAALLLTVSIAVSRLAGVLHFESFRAVAYLVILSVMSFSTAEVFAHLAANAIPLAPVAKYVVGVHAIVLIYMLVVWVRKKRQIVASS